MQSRRKDKLMVGSIPGNKLLFEVPALCGTTDIKIINNPLRPNNDLSQTSPCNIKGLSVREVLRIENVITQMKFY